MWRYQDRQYYKVGKVQQIPREWIKKGAFIFIGKRNLSKI